jgi:DNA-binding NarL/FixJ family response regulator
VKDYDSAVVAMARDLRPDLAARALAKGVDACVTLAGDVDEILEVIRSAVAGEGQPDAAGTGPEQPGPVRRARRGASGSPRARPTSCAC